MKEPPFDDGPPQNLGPSGLSAQPLFTPPFETNAHHVLQTSPLQTSSHAPASEGSKSQTHTRFQTQSRKWTGLPLMTAAQHLLIGRS